MKALLNIDLARGLDTRNRLFWPTRRLSLSRPVPAFKVALAWPQGVNSACLVAAPAVGEHAFNSGPANTVSRRHPSFVHGIESVDGVHEPAPTPPKILDSCTPNDRHIVTILKYEAGSYLSYSAAL